MTEKNLKSQWLSMRDIYDQIISTGVLVEAASKASMKNLESKFY